MVKMHQLKDRNSQNEAKRKKSPQTIAYLKLLESKDTYYLKVNRWP